MLQAEGNMMFLSLATIPKFNQFRLHAQGMVPLDFEGIAIDRATCSAVILQELKKRSEVTLFALQPANDSHPFPFVSFLDLDAARLLFRW